MKILLTGGAGFLGYHVANLLAEHGVTSVLYDLVEADLSEYPAGTVSVVGDIRDRAKLDAVIAEHQPERVVHGAAALPLWPKHDIMTVGIEGTRNVLAAAREAGLDRVVQISSTAVYGVPKKHPLDETDPVNGVGAYGIAKIAAETECREAREQGLTVAVIRPKTFIGTGRLGVFQILYDWVESGCRVPVIGNGKNRYQLLEVTDLVQAIRLCLTGEADQVNHTFNVGAKVFGTVLEDVGALCEYAASGARVQPTNACFVKAFLATAEALHLSPLYKWVYGAADTDSFVSTEKIEQALGWAPEYSNSDALIRSYQWYLDHKHELGNASGITHRVAWRQGILGVVKRFMKA